MKPQPTDRPWRAKITLAAIAGLTSGATRAIISKIFDYLASI